MYYSNLRIKILNIAKEECLVSDQAVPNVLIKSACKILKIKALDFSPYENVYEFDIRFDEDCERRKIKFCFEQLIKNIESNSY